MYQFSAMFKEMSPPSKPPSYRWRGMLMGFIGGWLPAWGISHFGGWGGWIFMVTWILSIPSGYLIGNVIKK